MVIFKDLIYGNATLGVYIAMSNNVCLFPPKANPKLASLILSINPNIIAIGNLNSWISVLGTYVAMNSYGNDCPECNYRRRINLAFNLHFLKIIKSPVLIPMIMLLAI